MKTLIPAAALAAALFSGAALGADPPKCRLVRIAEWPVKMQGVRPILDGTINGQKIGILLDTGAYASLLTKASAEKLGIATRGTSQYMSGVGGDSRIFLARIEDFRIGAARRENWRVRVGGERPIPGVDFILGDDFFRQVDLEFDYANGVIRLFQPENCKEAHLGYWDKETMSLPIEDRERIVVPIQLNGKRANALIDSGATASLASMRLAKEAGITPRTPGALPSNCASGIGAATIATWAARFDSITIGGERIRNPVIEFGDHLGDAEYWQNGPPDMILGADFLRSHRVYVSRTQGKVYYSYVGGPVFTAGATSAGCQAPLSPAEREEALKAHERALAASPGDAHILMGRALLWLQQGEHEKALADLDAAGRAAPADAFGVTLRAEVRGSMMRSRGDLNAAIVEFEKARRLDPNDTWALYALAAAYFHARRFEESEKAFEELMERRSGSFEAMWISFARVHQGRDGRSVLEEALAKLKGDEWPAPLLRYLLGQIDRKAVLALARAGGNAVGNECEVDYHEAAQLLSRSRPREARPLLEKARDACPRNYVEQGAAIAELAKLKE